MSRFTACCILLAGWLLALPAAIYAADYLIGEGDVLSVAVWGEKDLSVTVKVRPDGKITIPAIGEVAAANMTANELQKELAAKIGRLVKNPVVTVMVTEITNNKVYIFGGGVASGAYSLTQRMTLLQLLCQIGQPQPATMASAAAAPGGMKNADLKKAYMLRNGKKIKENFHDLFINGNVYKDIAIEPNDMIFIPSLTERYVYVMGAVTTPRSIEYRDGLTALAAILEAGGFTKYADQNDTVIYRDKETIPVKMKKMLSGGDLSQNLRLLPGDYIVVHEGIF